MDKFSGQFSKNAAIVRTACHILRGDYDAPFVRDLPAGVDPCGEHGEFHTFCYNGPIFRQPVLFERGEKVYREYPVNEQQVSGFWYCDLV